MVVNEVAVRTPGGGEAVLDEHDLVGAAEQQRADRRDDGGPAAAVGREPVGDPGLGVRGDGTGGFDQDEDRCVREQRPREGEPLALAVSRAASTRASPVTSSAASVVPVPGPKSSATLPSSWSRSTPVNSLGSGSLTTTWRRTSRTGRSSSRVPPQVVWCGPGP